MSFAAAREVIGAAAGTQLDPAMVEVYAAIPDATFAARAEAVR